MRSKNEAQRVRRKIRWSRLFMVMLMLLVMASTFVGAAFYAYINYSDATTIAGQTAGGKRPPETLNRRINILLLGVDDGDNEIAGGGPKRSDTMMVASISPQDGTVNLLSIPRDTRVMIPGRKGYDKITHAYAYGGPDLAVRTVQEFLHIPINYYAVANWDGFIKVVDILGGVDLYVEHDMSYNDPYANLDIHLKKGFQHLDGEKAGQYVRFRNDELGDIGRVQRQQRLLRALSDQMFSLGTIFKLPALTTTAKQYIETDMPPLMTLKMANTLKGFQNGALHTELLPGNFATMDGLSFWVPDRDKTQQLVEAMFTSLGAKVSGNLPAPGANPKN